MQAGLRQTSLQPCLAGHAGYAPRRTGQTDLDTARRGPPAAQPQGEVRAVHTGGGAKESVGRARPQRAPLSPPPTQIPAGHPHRSMVFCINHHKLFLFVYIYINIIIIEMKNISMRLDQNLFSYEALL